MTPSTEPADGKYFSSREEWRTWLENHHATESEIWLVYYKKHSGKESVAYEEAVEEALCFGWIDSRVMGIDEERYMQKYTPRKEKSNWSASNKRRIRQLTDQGKMTQAGLAMVEIAKENGSWNRLDQVETNPVMPEELARAFSANTGAKDFFNNLAPSHQKQYLWWLSSAKRPETRKKRASEIVKRCENQIKPGI